MKEINNETLPFGKTNQKIHSGSEAVNTVQTLQENTETSTKNILKNIEEMRRLEDQNIPQEKIIEILEDKKKTKKLLPRKESEAKHGAFDNIKIEETDQDKTLYKPFRVLNQILSAPFIALFGKGLFGIKRRIMENLSAYPGNSDMGISTLNITEGIRDIPLQQGVTTNAAIESWIKENSDKQIVCQTDASSKSENVTILWKKSPSHHSGNFQYPKYHFPIKKSDNQNMWALWRYIGVVLSAIPFALGRILGKNKSIFASRPTDLGNGQKQVSLQITPGLINSTLHNSGYIVNEALQKWIMAHPNAKIIRLSDSSLPYVGSDYKGTGGYTLSIVYEE